MAAESNLMITDKARLKREAANHFDWKLREPSCFLSVFTDERHARNWARQRGHDVCVTSIVTAMLPPEAHVFNATFLSGELGINHRYSEDELIFLHRIPWQSLGQTRYLLTDIIKETSPPAEVRPVQELNDNLAAFITHINDMLASLCRFRNATTAGMSVEMLASLRRILVSGFQDVMGSLHVVLEGVLKLNKTSSSFQSSTWDKGHAFRKLSGFVMELQNQVGLRTEVMDNLELAAPMPLPAPKKLTARELRIKRSENQKSRKQQGEELGFRDITATTS